MKRLAVAALICWLILPGIVNAQQKVSTTCAQTLRLARSVYENGRLHELESLLSGCISGTDFTVQERVDAYKLMTLAYIYLEEPEQADAMMLKILQTDPEFHPNDNIDPAEFVALWKTFRTEPVYKLGVKGGVNGTIPNVHSYTPVNQGSEKYELGFAFQAGISAEVAILDGMFYLNPELYYQVKSFKLKNKFFEDDQNTDGTVSMNWISLPISLQYPLHIGTKSDPKWVPYVGAGASIDYLVNVKSTLTTSIAGQSPVETTNTEKTQYKAFNFAPIISAGVKGKVKKAEIVAEIRYNFGVSTIFDKTRLYDSQSEVFGNKWIHGPFSLNTFSVSVGYLLNKYIPKKKSIR